MQRLTQAEMRYLQRSYVNSDLIIDAINNGRYLDDVYDYIYSEGFIFDSEGYLILNDVVENIYDRIEK